MPFAARFSSFAARVAVPAAICGTTMLAGCGAGTSPVDEATAKGILIRGNAAEPKGLDPHLVSGVLEDNIIRALFEGLCTEHPEKDGVPLPGAAESWEANADFTEWVFHLRKDARWSDGEPVTAEDFLFSYERILTPALGAEYAGMLYYVVGAQDFNEGKTTDFSTVGVSADDDYTLRVRLRGSIPFLPELVKHYTWYPVPKHTVLKFGRMDDPFSEWTRPKNIVSNGPFVLKSWRLNDHIEVEKNPLYWDAKTVGLNGVRFLPVVNGYTECRMFFNRQMHLTYTMPPELKAFAKEKFPDEWRGELYLGVLFMRCNTERGALGDKRVRKALSLALDRESLIENVVQGGQEPARGIVPPFGGYESPGTVRTDAAEARRLLAEAGFPGGAGFPDFKLLITDRDTAKKLGEAIQGMWRDELGIRVRIEQMEWGSYLQSQFEKQYDLALGGWIGDYLDPTTFLDMWVTDGGNNNTSWSNRDYEALLTEG
ncbi:MAG: peptide ABC transporter substrate-binding protein, partial [Verrucomicrobiae bacterium]|nr:peptide ABC transporter substrate-binding protein [Verrucomicrobiae bacterium]